jgi:hypothetical protein
MLIGWEARSWQQLNPTYSREGSVELVTAVTSLVVAGFEWRIDEPWARLLPCSSKRLNELPARGAEMERIRPAGGGARCAAQHVRVHCVLSGLLASVAIERRSASTISGPDAAHPMTHDREGPNGTAGLLVQYHAYSASP